MKTLKLIIIIMVLATSCKVPGLISKSEQREIISSHPEWDQTTVNYIHAGKIDVGFTVDMVKASWGYPQRVNETVTGRGITYQLVYPDYPGDKYVYIENDTVVAIQR